VGIGTVSPNSLLNLNHATNSQLRLNTTALGNTTTDGLLFDLNSTAASINLYENLPLYFATNGTNKMVITSGGNVGLNTTSPGKLAGATYYFTLAQADGYNSDNVSLELQGSTATGVNGSVSRIDFINQTAVSNHLARVEARTGSGLNDGRLVFSTHDGTSLVERMKIMNDGKVGVGLASATNPATMLDVNGYFALRQVLASDAAAFNPLDVTNRSLINMNALTSNFEIRSIRGTGDGKILTIINPTSFSMSIRDQSSGFGLASERVITGTGGTVSYPGPCVVTLVYNITSTRWFISSVASGASNANLWSKTGSTTYLTNSTDFVGIGTSTPTERIHILSTDSDIDAETVSGTESSSLHIKRAAGTLATPTLLPNGQYFGGVSFQGYDGTDYREGARIQASVDGVTAINDMPGRLEFWTTPDGTNTALERMRLTNSGNLGIGTTTPGNTKLYVTIPSTDATNNSALTIDNNYTGASVKYGIDVNVDGAGSGSKYGISSSVVGLAADASQIYGYQVNMVPNGTGTSNGLYSVTSAVGTGIRYGIYNTISNAAGNASTMYGIRNNLSGGTGYKYGIYNQGEDGNYFSGDVGIGTAAPLVKLDINGSMALRKPADINLTAGAQIDPATTSYVRFTGGGGTYTLANPSILSGSVAGQMLILTSNHGGTTIVQHAGIVRLAGGVNYSMGAYDSLTLIWDGAMWIELSRSNNQ
jgi:hypothetical protein